MDIDIDMDMDMDIDTDIGYGYGYGYGSPHLYNPQPGLPREKKLQKSPEAHVSANCI